APGLARTSAMSSARSSVIDGSSRDESNAKCESASCHTSMGRSGSRIVTCWLATSVGGTAKKTADISLKNLTLQEPSLSGWPAFSIDCEPFVALKLFDGGSQSTIGSIIGVARIVSQVVQP